MLAVQPTIADTIIMPPTINIMAPTPISMVANPMMTNRTPHRNLPCRKDSKGAGLGTGGLAGCVAIV